MIKFDKNGNPSPPGVVKISTETFKEIFVDAFDSSQTRPVIYESYSSYCNDFKATISEKFDQWLNGSYTTNKVDPNDIDLVSIVDVNENLNATDLKSFLTAGGSREKYKVDGYFIPVYDHQDPRREVTEHWLSHWADFFGHDRLRRKKALIQVSFK